MKKTIMILSIVLAVVAISTSSYATTRNELKYLEYSDQLLSQFDEVFPKEASKEDKPVVELDEVASNHEQLCELAKTRAIVSEQKSQSATIRNKIEKYWNKILPKKVKRVSMAIKQQIVANIRQNLNLAGYNIVYMKILDLPKDNPEYKVRAVVRAYKALKTKNSYKEIQKNLKELKNICQMSATLGNHMFLSELTTFIAVNPKTKFYYEKTILK